MRSAYIPPLDKEPEANVLRDGSRSRNSLMLARSLSSPRNKIQFEVDERDIYNNMDEKDSMRREIAGHRVMNFRYEKKKANMIQWW